MIIYQRLLSSWKRSTPGRRSVTKVKEIPGFREGNSEKKGFEVESCKRERGRLKKGGSKDTACQGEKKGRARGPRRR